MLRLHKFLAEAGLASRREAERWIVSGRVAVNGKTVTRLGTQVDPSQDRVEVDGRSVAVTPKKVAYLFHKPKNVMVTRHDPQGRPTVFDYFKKVPERLFPVGRLDFDSEGLLLLTNDGDLANRIMHPRTKVPKVYWVRVDRPLSGPERVRLKEGIEVTEGLARAREVRPIHPAGESARAMNAASGTWLEITLSEGKRRQIRRMLEVLGIQVLRLVRVRIGPFSLGALRPGQWQPISLPVDLKD